MCADAPNTSGINKAAVESAKLGREALEWFKGEYSRTQGQRDQAAATSQQVAQAQLEAMQTQTGIAKDYDEYNKTVFRPLETSMVDAAKGYDTPERRAAAATEAVADVETAAGRARQARMATLAGYGISPETGMSQSIDASTDINTARTAAGAAKGARDRVEDMGWARMADAASLGRGLPSAQTAAMATGTNAGNSAVGASNASLNATNSGAGMMGAGFNTALQGSGQAGQLYGTAAGVEGQARGQDLGLLGSVFSSFMKSDPKVKKDRKTEAPTASMAALRKTPIESWKYDPAKGGPEDGDQTRVGPMADAANDAMGEEVAPGGEMLNVASMVGVVANAVKDIDKRLARIEQRKAA